MIYTSRYRHRDVRLGYLLYLIKRSSTCRERVTEVEEAFIAGAGASYVCFSYQMRHHSRAGCSPGLDSDTDTELRLPVGSAARQEQSPGPDWPCEAARVAGTPMMVAYGPADHAYEVAASAEGPVGRGGRSRPIASFVLFCAITGAGKGLR